MTHAMVLYLMEIASPWGTLPPALILGIILGARLGALALPQSLPPERLLFGAVSAVAVIVGEVRLLGAMGCLSRGTILGGLLACTIAACLAGRNRRIGVRWREAITRETVTVAAVAFAGLVGASLAAYLLPIWQWDSLGYHLPYVNLALQSRGFAGVPNDMPYVATYPHVVESFFIAWRAMLPDDRLLDAAQIPFGVLGALAIAVLARQVGARSDHATAAGLLWLTFPAVFLQLPTDYVDVASAALLLSATALCLAEPITTHGWPQSASPQGRPPTAWGGACQVIGAGVALGLFLGSKPNAPLGAALLFGVLAIRGWKAGRRGSLAAAAACMLLLGGESYVTNLVRYGNPLWPVQVSLGPWVFPGRITVDVLLAAGCAAPRVHGSLPVRMLRSWAALDAPPIFDMRYGGLGLIFLAALPVAIAVVVRRRSIPLAVVMVAALTSPDPAVPRYVLAFPGVVLALAASWVSTGSARVRWLSITAASLVAAAGLFHAYPALAGDGPALSAYLSMPQRERLRAVGADGSPARFFDALEQAAPNRTTAFDSSLDLSYLAWPSDLSRRAIRIPDGAADADAARILANRDIDLLIVGEGSPVAKAALEADPAFTQLFRCKQQPLPACAAAAAAAASAASTSDTDHLLDILNQRWSSCVVLLRK